MICTGHSMGKMKSMIICRFNFFFHLQGKRFKVWTSDKGVGKVIFANTFEDLVEKAKSKLEIEGQVKIVLDDSCEIDDDDALGGVADMASLFVLAENQELTLPSSSGQNSEDRLKAIMHSLKKRKIDSQKRPSPANLKFSIGWFNYSAKLKRYVNVRTHKGGGIHSIEVTSHSPCIYDQIMEKMKDLFFPNGKSPLGKIALFDFTIGDNKGTIITEKAKITDHSRVNLLSKQKAITIDDDSDSDFDLPEISFSRDGANNRRNNLMKIHLITYKADYDCVIENVHCLFQYVIHEIIASKTQETQSSRNTYSISARRPSSHLTQEHTVKRQQTVQNNSGLDMISNRNTEQTTPLLQSVSVTSGNTYVSAGTPTVSFNIDNNRCTICYERNKESFFIPCGHTVCTVCAVTQQSGNSSCPYCRATIQGIGNIHN
ncbi:uncharacterized protein LOC132724945 [Ruditapes philippinarum]|uniref:uncharacterized protein LOC132724945 n=1 Tax=Ruditapes philippinarum TaxID=129788 RepID=UPI00295BDD7F|nr:uncharacterized protein LOC132724945 [Ruditapes philippinarum]